MSNLELWKARLAHRDIALSDGLVMTIRPVHLENLVMNGHIPLTVMREIETVKPKPDGTYSDEDTLRMAKAIDAVVMAAAVDPRVSEFGGEDSIALADIRYTDRVRIFEEVNGPTAAMSTFRGEPDGDAADADDGEDVRLPAE